MDITEAGPQSKWILLQIRNKNKMTTNTQLCAFPTAAGLPDRACSVGPHAALRRGRAAAGARLSVLS